MKKLLILTAILMLLGGCSAQENTAKGSYMQISQEEAKRIMEEESDYLIVDVRREDEFAQGHIPGAVNIPNESIIDTKPPLLPDTEQLLLIYCRSGNRSKQAAQKLAGMGYSKVYEFGGISTWDGEIVKD